MWLLSWSSAVRVFGILSPLPKAGEVRSQFPASPSCAGRHCSGAGAGTESSPARMGLQHHTGPCLPRHRVPGLIGPQRAAGRDLAPWNNAVVTVS